VVASVPWHTAENKRALPIDSRNAAPENLKTFNLELSTFNRAQL
jgi:hypothetical protein